MATIKAGNIEWIDAAKGACILMVVLHHSIVTSYHIPLSDHLFGIDFAGVRLYELISKNLAPLRMPLFFMLSGFLVQRSVNSADWRLTVQNRVVNLIYLFLLWGAIQWITVSIIHKVMTGDWAEGGKFNAIYADDILEYVQLTIIGSTSLWYLYALPIYFIICKLLSPRPWTAIAILLLVHFLSRRYITVWPTTGIFANAVYYAVGCFFGMRLFDLLSKFDKRTALLLALSIASVLAFGLLGVWGGAATSFLFIVLSIIFFAWIQKKFELRSLRWIGRNTLQIYVIHRIVLEIPSVVLASSLVTDEFFLNPTVVTLWCTLYPALATATVVMVCLTIWRATNRGMGRFLYQAPELRMLAPASKLAQ
ncbi:MAG: hypothetical protein JWM78_2231 [Verrucomicrobiaceae bacterium]|nr:hypothetical protein [Verrucomicrobiaceae bacterium]